MDKLREGVREGKGWWGGVHGDRGRVGCQRGLRTGQHPCGSVKCGRRRVWEETVLYETNI